MWHVRERVIQVVWVVVQHLVCMNVIKHVVLHVIRCAQVLARVLVNSHAKVVVVIVAQGLVLELVRVQQMPYIIALIAIRFVQPHVKMVAKSHVLVAVKLVVIVPVKKVATRDAKHLVTQPVRITAKVGAKATAKEAVLEPVKLTVQVVVREDVLVTVEVHAGDLCSLIHSPNLSNGKIWRSFIKFKTSNGSLAWQRASRLLSLKTAS